MIKFKFLALSLLLLFSIKTYSQCLESLPILVDVTTFSSTEIRVQWTPAMPLVADDISVTYSNGIEYKLETSPTWTKIINPSPGIVPITSLAPDTRYQIRVFVNSSCIYDDPDVGNEIQNYVSASLTKSTYPSTPQNFVAVSNTSTSINVSWNLVTTTNFTNYYLDIRTSIGYLEQNIFVAKNINSYVFNSLTPGTNYIIRIRAHNNTVGDSEFATVTIPTRPDKPVILDPIEVRSTAFKARWNSVTGSTSYRLDVAADNNFTLPTINNRSESSSPSQDVESLLPNTTYYYRVRSVNSSGASVSSDVKEFRTAPSAPVLFDKSNVSSSGFQVNWSAANGATEYDIYVYTDASFTQPLTNYNPKTIPAPETTTIISGLTPSTNYYLKLQARNLPRSTNSGSPYKELLVSTLPAGGGGSFAFGEVTYNASHTFGLTNLLRVNLIGGTGAKQVKLFHRKNTEVIYSSHNLSLVANAYEINIDDDWVDELGMQFYIEAKDELNQVIIKENLFVKTKLTQFSFPLQSNGSEINNYQMISFPYSFDNNSVRDVMESVLGEYNKKKWRFSFYKNGKLIDFDEGLAAGSLEQGQAYWLISRNPATLSWSNASSFGNHTNAPSVITLTQGWNQVGNPFPFEISWQQVLENNSLLVDKVSPLYRFDQEFGSFIQSDILPVFGGGFVFAEELLELNFPVSLKNQQIPTNNLTERNNKSEILWKLPISINSNKVTNFIGGVGMRLNQDVKNERDKYDNLNPPSFDATRLCFTEQTVTPEISFSWVPDTTHFTWNLQVKAEDVATLFWEIDDAQATPGSLWLYNAKQGRLIDMKRNTKAQVDNGDKLALIYNSSTTEIGDELVLGQPFPNPMIQNVRFPLYTDTFEPIIKVNLTIVNTQGLIVIQKSESLSTNEYGLTELLWDGKSHVGDVLPSGLYFYRLDVEGYHDLGTSYCGKLIKK